MSTSGQTDLLRLSREQLKQLCKERGHTGYSKCTKPQLVALLGSDTPSKFNLTMMITALPSKQDTSSSASASKKRLVSAPDTEESVTKKQRRPNPIPLGSGPSMQSSMTSVPFKARGKPRLAQKSHIPRDLFELPVSTTPVIVSLPTQQLPVPLMSQLPSSFADRSLSLPQPPESSSQLHQIREAEKQENRISLPAADFSQRLPDRNAHTQLFKKFLDPRNSATSSYLVPGRPQDTLYSTILSPSPNVSVEPLPTPYLDFPAFPAPILGMISMPPSISDRRKVHSWSIILSGISNADRRTCILVSRMFRYAGKSTLCLLSRWCLISTLG